MAEIGQRDWYPKRKILREQGRNKEKDIYDHTVSGMITTKGDIPELQEDIKEYRKLKYTNK